MPTVIELGQKVKQKYPGAYDDLTDLELGQKTKAKYPEYNDFTDVAPAPKGDFITRTANATKNFPGAVIGEAVGTSVAAIGRIFKGDTQGAKDILATQVSPRRFGGDVVRSIAAPLSFAVNPGTSVLKSAGQFGALSAAQGFGKAFTSGKDNREVAKETLKSGATGAVVAGTLTGVFNLLGKGVKAATPDTASFLSGVPKKAIQEAIQNPAGARIGRTQTDVEGIRKSAVEAYGGLTKTLGDEYAQNLGAIQQAYKTRLVESAQKAAKGSLLPGAGGQIGYRGNKEAAERIFKTDVSKIKSITGARKAVQESLGTYKNYPLVKEAVENWTKSSRTVADALAGKPQTAEAVKKSLQGSVDILRNFRVGVKNELGKKIATFGRSAIVKSGEQRNIQQALQRVDQWNDFSPGGLDALAQALGELRRFDTPMATKSSAVLGKVYHEIAGKGGLIHTVYPELHAMRQSHSAAKKVLDEIGNVLGAQATKPTQIQSSINRLTNIYKEDKETYLTAIRELSKKSGQDIIGKLAGTEFQNYLPQYVRGLGGGGVVAVGSAILNPWTMLLAPLFSPRAWGKAIQTAPRFGRSVSRAIKSTIPFGASLQTS